MNETKDILDLVMNKLIEWYESIIQMLPNFVLAALVLVAFYGIARLVRSMVRKGFSRVFQRESLIKLLTSIVYVVVIIIGMFVALSVMNLNKTVTSLLAGAGILGLAFAFAFQDIAANFMAGFMMAINSPIRVGDLIETNDIKGRIQHIHLRTTEMLSLQGQLVIIPNKDIFQNPLYNYSITARYRVDLECGVSYGDDLDKVREVTIGALQNVPHRLLDKEVEMYYTEFGGSSINLETRIWIQYDRHADYLEARSEAIIALKNAYDEADIMMPFPISTLDFGIRGGKSLAEIIKDPMNQLMSNLNSNDSEPLGNSSKQNS